MFRPVKAYKKNTNALLFIEKDTKPYLLTLLKLFKSDDVTAVKPGISLMELHHSFAPFIYTVFFYPQRGTRMFITRISIINAQ